MDLIPLNIQLRRGCDAVDVSFDVAAELLTYLEIGKLPPEKNEFYSPSAKMEKLLHWILLNTEARKVVEQSVGAMNNSTVTAGLDQDMNCVRRLQTLNVLAGHGWTPKLAVWEEPHTSMHKIKTVKLLTTDGDVPLKTFTMYCTDRHGLYEIHKRMSENDYSTNRDGLQALKGHAEESQQPAKRQKTTEPAVDDEGRLTIKIRVISGSITTYLIRASSQVAVLLNACARHFVLDPEWIRLSSNGVGLSPNETIQFYLDSGYDMEMIDAYNALGYQEGC